MKLQKYLKDIEGEVKTVTLFTKAALSTEHAILDQTFPFRFTTLNTAKWHLPMKAMPAVTNTNIIKWILIAQQSSAMKAQISRPGL